MSKRRKRKAKQTVEPKDTTLRITNADLPKRRGTWVIDPTQRPHSTKNGKKGYKRSDNKRIEREATD
jgi:hypothetical protein